MPNKKVPIEELNRRKPKNSALTAIKYLDPHKSPSGITRSVVLCACKCGKEKEAIVGDFTRGNPMSCGCGAHKDPDIKIRSALIKRWKDMRNRCYNPSCSNYKTHGAKGVRVCDEWLNNPNNFIEWAMDNGFSVDLQLDKDILGDGKLYSPKTCKWVTPLENMRATAQLKYLFNGKMRSVSEISRITGMHQSYLRRRLKSMTADQAVADYRKPKFKEYSNK